MSLGFRTGSRTRPGLGGCRCELEMLFAWIGGGDHDTDGFLVEALEPAVPLQVLQVTAKGAFFDELIELLAGDQAGRQKALGPLAPHGPAFALGKGLAQEIKIRKG